MKIVLPMARAQAAVPLQWICELPTVSQKLILSSQTSLSLIRRGKGFCIAKSEGEVMISWIGKLSAQQLK